MFVRTTMTALFLLAVLTVTTPTASADCVGGDGVAVSITLEECVSAPNSKSATTSISYSVGLLGCSATGSWQVSGASGTGTSYTWDARITYITTDGQGGINHQNGLSASDSQTFDMLPGTTLTVKATVAGGNGPAVSSASVFDCPSVLDIER